MWGLYFEGLIGDVRGNVPANLLVSRLMSRESDPTRLVVALPPFVAQLKSGRERMISLAKCPTIRVDRLRPSRKSHQEIRDSPREQLLR